MIIVVQGFIFDLNLHKDGSNIYKLMVEYIIRDQLQETVLNNKNT